MKCANIMLAGGLALSVGLLGSTSLVSADEAVARQLDADLSELFEPFGISSDDFEVTSLGTTYLVEYSFDRLIASLAENDIQVTFDGVLSEELEPVGNGEWNYVGLTLPDITASVEVDGNQVEFLTYKFIEPIEITGTLNLEAGLYEFADITIAEFQSETFAEPGPVTTVGEDLRIRLNASLDEAGTYDLSLFTSIARVTQNLPVADGMSLAVSLENMETTTNYEGLALGAVSGLVQFLADRWDEDELSDADQLEMLSLIEEALPVVEFIDYDALISSMVIETPVGPVSLQNLDMAFSTDGVVDDGAANMGFRFDGLTLPAAAVPPWATQIVPQVFNLGIEAHGYDLDAPIQYALENVDVTADDPMSEEQRAQFSSLLLPDETVELELTAGLLESDLYSVTIEGGLSVYPETDGSDPSAEAQFVITMDGLDDVMSHLSDSAGSDPMVQQIIPGLFLAKGMSETGPDGEAIWEIEIDRDENVFVNGQKMNP